MLFNSYIFILFFLPVTLVVYYGFQHFHRETGAKVFLLGMSLWFYAYFHVSYLAVILLSVLFNYGISRMLASDDRPAALRKGILAAGITVNLAVIFYFKYFDFFLANLGALLHTGFVMRNILMPLGISFFTFQQISYLVDSYRKETKGYGLLDYAVFVTFFPQLVAGPIVTHDQMMPQFAKEERRHPDQDYLARGIALFSVGLSKKVLLADTLGAGADWAFSNTGILSAADVIVASLLFTLQIYFDFSGYCDMACGIASMFHIDLPINFNSPYKALSIREFWGKWHISLSGFLKKYVYFPLGGSRKGKVRTYLNLMIVFLVSGIWHGANWTYILWGLAHGTAQVAERLTEGVRRRIPKILRLLVTFVFVDAAWVLFRADSVADCLQMFAAVFTWRKGGLHPELLDQFRVIEFTYLEEHLAVLRMLAGRIEGLYMWIVMGIALLLVFVPANCYEKKFKPTAANAAKSVILLVWSVLSLSGLSIFLYFNF